MKVVDLQSFLESIAPFVKAAGASEKCVAELGRARECLEPFKEKSLLEFNEFLRRADEFDRTGQLQVATMKRASKPRAAKSPTMTVEAAVKLYLDLQIRATDPTLSFEAIDAQLAPFNGLTVAELKEVAGKVGVTLSGKATKAKIVEELARRVKELKATNERTQSAFGGAESWKA